MLGGAYTLVTLFMGGFSHAIDTVGHIGHGIGGGHSIDISHGAGHGHDLGSHAGADHGGAHHGHGHAHADAQAHHSLDSDGNGKVSLLEYFNPMSVAGFLLGFGGLGVLSGTVGATDTARLLYGFSGGFGLWMIAYLLISKMFGKAEHTSHTRADEGVGLRGQVVAPIAGDKPGMVQFIVAGTRQSLRAITEDDEPIPMGATVRIRRISNRMATVMRLDTPFLPSAALHVDEIAVHQGSEPEP